MGCDIHCYIEYKDGDSFNDFGGRINPGRNYEMFELMAGVRGEVANALIEPRGMPQDAGSSARYDNTHFIYKGATDDHSIEPEKAEKWVKDGIAEYIYDNQGKPTWVTNPDWHSHSWLTTAEFAKVLRSYKAKAPYSVVEYEAILAAMQSFEDAGFSARLVFWFDN